MKEVTNMKNFIFISPNFPENYWKFCRELAKNGLRVLGIGDCPYDELREELKNSLTEYYKVSSLENYDEVYRAVAFFIHKYGRIDWLESNNEYWLERDAFLRKDFHITSGFQPEDMAVVKYKSRMKERYARAGIPFARYHLVENEEGCRKFIAEVGYPVVVKPDNGVGANATFKLNSDEELKEFLSLGLDGYIMEEFINGEICSFDAIVNSRGEPIFETGNCTPVSLMDVVNEQKDSIFYIEQYLPVAVRERGEAALKSFGVKSRFVHFEFFRLLSDCHLGKKGDIVALEVNMRPSGGISPDMMNYANGVDVYKIWADMIAYDGTLLPLNNEHNYCAFIGRRDGADYALSDEEALQEYGAKVKAYGRVSDALAPAMGNRMVIANFSSEREMVDFFRKMSERK